MRDVVLAGGCRVTTGRFHMDLTLLQARGLARRIIARNAADPLEWEDYPELTSEAFDRLERAAASYATQLSAQADDADLDDGVDSLALLANAR